MRGARAGLGDVFAPAREDIFLLRIHREFVLEPEPVAAMLDEADAAPAPDLAQLARVVEALHVPVAQEVRAAGQGRDPPVEGEGRLEAEMVAQPLGGAAAIAERDDMAERGHGCSLAFRPADPIR